MKTISPSLVPTKQRRVLPVLLCLLILVLLPQLFADPGGIEYTVREGDTLESVAKQFNMTVRELKRQLEKPLTPGAVIVLNPSGESKSDLISKYIEEYKVKPGDTLQQIAQNLKNDKKISMSVEELADFNGIERREHEVQSGETVTQIARRYHVTREQLHEWNDLPLREDLPPGRLLTVGWEEPRVGEWLEYPNTYAIAEAVQRTARTIEPINNNIRYDVYEVRRNDTLKSIASRFDVMETDLREINGLNEGEALEEGEPLLIPQPKDENMPITSGIPWMSARGALEARVGTVASDNAQVRFPGAAGRRPLRQGVKLVIIGEEGNQVAVMMPDEARTGWVNKQDVKFTGRAFSSVPPQGRAAELLNLAQSYMGTPYVFGGSSRRGIDCSHFVQAVFRSTVGTSVPPPCRYQVRQGIEVPLDPTKFIPGDRLYFDGERLGHGVPHGVDHTGIYMGGGKFIHATPPRVRIDPLSGRYWKILAAVRRDPRLVQEFNRQSPLIGTRDSSPLGSLFGMFIEHFQGGQCGTERG